MISDETIRRLIDRAADSYPINRSAGLLHGRVIFWDDSDDWADCGLSVNAVRNASSVLAAYRMIRRAILEAQV